MTGSAKKTILLVEDDPDIRASCEELLALEGHEVRMAEDGHRGLAALRQSPPPDLVLLDMMMPEMTGQEFLQAMQREPQLRDIPVLAVTALGDKQIPGTVAMLPKPFDANKLWEMVRKYAR